MRNKCICIHKPYDISITIELHLANNFIPNKNKKKKKNKVKKIPPPLKTRLKKNHTHKKTPNTKHYTFVIPMHGSLIYNAVLTCLNTF